MSIQCPHCQSPIDDSVVDRTRQIANCGACGRIVDLQPQLSDGAAGHRLRPPVALPAGMSITDDGMTLVIRRRWLRTKHFAFLAVLAALTAGVAYQWAEAGSSGILIAATIFVSIWNIRLLTMFVNTTTIRASSDRIDVTHGPLPTLMFRNQSLSTQDIRQLFAARWAAVFEVGAELSDGSRVPLARPVVSEEQAFFIEQQLERRLGLVDFEVDGELASANPLPEVPAAVSAGAGGAMAVLPLLLGVVGVGAFIAMTSSSVEGKFEASGERLGSFTFVVDDCRSGETRGFFGAELTSTEDRGTVVRAMRDPVRGTLIAIERDGNKPVVLSPEDCAGLDVQVSRNNTNVNDVWGVVGRAQANCDEFRGSVTFDGCY